MDYTMCREKVLEKELADRERRGETNKECRSSEEKNN